MTGVLLMEDGRHFPGEGFGAKTTSAAEVVFNTGMTGYQEILTDPSYTGQMVTMTTPHIGNTGVNSEDGESVKIRAAGLIVRELCTVPSNYRSSESLDSLMKREGIPGLTGIDTRALTRHLRDQGAMMGILSTETDDLDRLAAELKKADPIGSRDLVKTVTIKENTPWPQSADEVWYYNRPNEIFKRPFRVIAYDFGIKANIARLLKTFGAEPLLVPAATPAEEVLAMKPDGIFLSNGPGDPVSIPYASKEIKKFFGHVPVFGICLGHQLIGLAAGALTYKLKFGHHGCNHPVMDLQTGRISITSQNHNYAIDEKSLKKTGFEVTHLNLNDRTVEGIRHQEMPIMAIQYHPEAAPGPHDALDNFIPFFRMMQKQP